jgi:hypothetical protein
MFTGFVVLHVLTLYMPNHYAKTSAFILLSAIFAIFPDLDILWSKSLKDHHDSAFHMPFFWATVTVLFLVLGLSVKWVDTYVVLLLFIQVFVHLTLDFITGRFAGLKLLAPFSDTWYSMFELKPRHGNFNVKNIDKNVLRRYINYYFKNKTLITFESSFIALGIIVLI